MSQTDKTIAPPHSLTLRAKQRSMPNTPGVHVHKPEQGEASSADSAGEESTGDAEISPRVREIHAAISQVPLNDAGSWTKTKGPKVSALEKLLGYTITEAERDAAWAI